MPATTDVRALRQQSEDLEFESKRLKAEARGIFASSDAEKRGLTEDETARLDAIEGRQASIDRNRKSLETEITEAQAAEKAAPARAVVQSVREAVEDDPMRGFKSSSEFYRCVMSAGPTGNRADARLRPLQIGAAPGSDEQQGADNDYGGYWVPRLMASQLLAVTPEMDPTVGRTMDIPMAGARVDLPARVDKDHSASVTGGFTVARRAEAAIIASSRIATEVIALDAKSLAGLAYVTEEILADSVISFAAVINQAAAQAFASKELSEKLNGNGTTQMAGVIGHAATITTTRAAAAAITGAEVLAMRARCWGYGSAIWIANHELLPILAGASLTGSGTNTDFPMFVPGNGTDVPDTLLGRPIFFSEYAEATNTPGDLVLGNWGEYLFGQFEGVTAAESMHIRFDYNERAYRFVKRNDGKPWWTTALTPVKGTATLSPFVILGAGA